MGRQRASRPDTRPTHSFPEPSGPSCTVTAPRAPGCANSGEVAIAGPALPPRPVSLPHGSHLCLTNARPRPLPTLPRSAPPLAGSTNNRVGLEALGGPAANAHAVGGPPAGIGGEATAFCPHSGRGAGGPRGAPAVKMASAADGDVGEALEQMRGLWPGVEDLSLNKLASSLGASEQALRLIISIFLGKDPPVCLCPLAESQGNWPNGDGTCLSAPNHPGGLGECGCRSSSTPASYRGGDTSLVLSLGVPYLLPSSLVPQSSICRTVAPRPVSVCGSREFDSDHEYCLSVIYSPYRTLLVQ